MSGPRILLVTGARVIEDTVAAQRWACDYLYPILARYDVLYVGDAPGVDAIAWGFAWLRSMERSRWRLDGWVQEHTPTVSTTWRWWEEHQQRPVGRQWPLARNHRMAHAFVRRVNETRQAHGTVLSIYAPWSKTAGTAHTVGRVRSMDSRIEVLEETCPSEYGPAQ